MKKNTEQKFIEKVIRAMRLGLLLQLRPRSNIRERLGVERVVVVAMYGSIIEVKAHASRMYCSINELEREEVTNALEAYRKQRKATAR